MKEQGKGTCIQGRQSLRWVRLASYTQYRQTNMEGKKKIATE